MARMTTNTSGHTGVSFDKSSGKWQASIQRGGIQRHLGYFADIEDAVSARKKAEKDEPGVRKGYDAETQAWIDEAETQEERKHRQQKAKYDRHGHKYRPRINKQYEEDPEKILARNAKWRAENPEKVTAGKADWERRFKEEHPEEWQEQRRAIAERRKPKTAAYGKEWRKKNPHLNAKKQAAYKARKQQATVEWANDFIIEEIFALAQLRSEMTGIMWEVDHIVPLMNDKVCGLHVENNLRVIPEIENRRKHAQFGDGIPADHLWT